MVYSNYPLSFAKSHATIRCVAQQFVAFWILRAVLAEIRQIHAGKYNTPAVLQNSRGIVMLCSGSRAAFDAAVAPLDKFNIQQSFLFHFHRRQTKKKPGAKFAPGGVRCHSSSGMGSKFRPHSRQNASVAEPA